MKTNRQTQSTVRVLIQNIENSKPVSSKSFTVYETDAGEVLTVCKEAIEAQAEDAAPAKPRRSRKSKASAEASEAPSA